MRVMPNTPALVGEGMTALCDDSTFSKEDFDYVKGIFDSIGKTRILPERLFDGVTAISGSSPASVYMRMEAMADAGKVAWEGPYLDEVSGTTMLISVAACGPIPGTVRSCSGRASSTPFRLPNSFSSAWAAGFVSDLALA